MTGTYIGLVFILGFQLALAANEVDMCNADVTNRPCMMANDELRFEALNDTATYQLAAFQEEAMSWVLGPYVEIARQFILSIGGIEWAYIKGLYLGTEEFDIPKLVTMQLPIIIAAGFGVLVAILTCISGSCFCCCRCCCNKCGAKLSVRDAQDQNRCCAAIVGISLLACLVILVVGSGSIYTVGQRIPTTGHFLGKTVEYSIADLLAFVNELFRGVSKVARDDLTFAVDAVMMQLDNLPTRLLGGFMTTLRPLVQQILTGILSLDTDIQQLADTLTSLGSTIDDVVVHADSLQLQLTAVGATIVELKANCTASHGAGPPCSILPSDDIVPDPYDFSLTPSMAEQTDILNTVQSLNLSSLVDTVNDTFEGLPALVKNETADIVASVADALNGAVAMVEPLLDVGEAQIKNASTEFEAVGRMIAGLLPSNATDLSNPTAVMAQQMMELVVTAFLGLASLPLLIIVFATLGLLCGCCGVRARPEQRSKVGNCAHCCLMTTIFFCVIFGLIFLLIGSLLFFVGANLTIGCESLEDLSFLQETVDDPSMWDGEYIMSKAIFGNGSIVLTAKGVLQRCQSHQAVYSALKLQHLMDFDDIVDLNGQMPDIAPLGDSVNASVSEIVLISASTKADLDSVLGNEALNMNATDMMRDLNQGMANLSLAPLLTSLQTAADDIRPHDTVISEGFEALHAQVTTIDTVLLPALTISLARMTDQLTNMSVIVRRVGQTVYFLVDDATQFEFRLKNEGINMVLDSIGDFIWAIFMMAEQIKDHVINSLNSDIGKCGALWDVYHGTTNAICGYFLDALNGLWLSMCIIGLFCLPIFILAACMSQYFRRTETVAQVGAYPTYQADFTKNYLGAP